MNNPKTISIPARIPALVLTALLLAGGGCAQEKNISSIELPPTPRLSLRENWAVITTSTMRLRSQPDTNADLITTFFNRRGVVLEVISRGRHKVFIEGREDFWYRVIYDGLSGWVFGGNIELHNSREQALRASRTIR